MNIFNDNKEDSYPENITDNLYIGNLSNATNKQKLNELGITHILICASYIEPTFPNVILIFIIKNFKEFIYKQIDIHDLPNCNLQSFYDESYK